MTRQGGKLADLGSHAIPRKPEPGPLANPAYLTSREVGAMIRVSSRTVERWALEDATMPVTRIGRLLRFERGALEAWLARHSTQGARKGRASGRKSASNIDTPTDSLSAEPNVV
jgi:excisionase family DNA binding protein